MTDRGQNFIRDAQNLYSKYEELLKKHCGIEKKTFSVSTLYYAFARKAFVKAFMSIHFNPILLHPLIKNFYY